MKIPKQNPQQMKLELQKKLKGASKMYEEQFLREMVKAMRGTISHSSMTKPSMGEKIYRQQLDEQYVQSWTEKGGVGFADMIYRDLVDKYYPMLKGPRQKEIRPISITDHFRGMVKAPGKGNKQNYKVDVNPQSQNTPLKAPWVGKVDKEFKLPDGRQLVSVVHPQGMRSTFVFDGSAKPGLKGTDVGAGEIFAELKANVNSMLMQIEKTDQQKPAVGATEEEF